MVRFQTFEQYHNKKNVGSTNIRVRNLLKHWPEADVYKYGENPDVLIFQKVYVTQDYTFPKHFNNIKILDICDPDWLEGALIRETIDAVDAVTCPTQPLADFLANMTDKPIKVIKDRFDVAEFPTPKIHHGKLKTIVWFGYQHNADVLKLAMPSIAARLLKVIIISDGDPGVHRWAGMKYEEYCTYYKYDQKALYRHLQEADIAVFPQGFRPQDKYKSENKTVIAKLCGLPVATNAEEIDALMEAADRNQAVRDFYDKTRKGYNCKRSVEEYKLLIQEISVQKGQKDGK